MEGGGERVEGRDDEAEADAQGCRGNQEQPVGQSLGTREELARDKEAHRHEAGEEPEHEDALEAAAPG
jgi:hypothetical protein